jgi:clan AA aspartic protease (TIGR02281 family)
MRKLISAIALLSVLGACASPPPSPPPRPVAAAPQSQALRVPLTASAGGTPRVAVAIDGACCVSFTVDSGASDVSVSPELFSIMVKHGRVTKADLIDVVKYQTANGVTEGLRFRMPPMTVGGRTVHGVTGSVSKNSNSLLLGQSFLKRFRFWAIDNANGVLVLGT